MQLTLPTPTFAQPSVAPQPAPTAARPQDDAVFSQLDQIAAQNLQATRQGLGASEWLLALVGGLVIVGGASMWGGGDEPLRKTASRQQPAVAVAQAQAPVAEATPPALPAVAMAAAPTVAQAAALTVVEPTAAAAPQPATQAAAVGAEPAAAADDGVRKARVAKALEARRKAAQLAQARTLAEETQRLQLAQQRQSERAQQQQLAEQARQRAAAAEQARLASLQLAMNTPRSVTEMCSAAGNFFSQQFCRSRECGKAEHQGDAACVRQREHELAQQRASNER